jgi:DNA invertase Pin-like site-specific DNA recombinase
MSGRGYKKQSKNQIAKRIWLTGGYNRRSFDDGEVAESYTITNQKALIEDFIEDKNDIKIVDYYSDDGYTGTNFERPEFKRLMNDIVNGKINCIIVKDLSRLGRNHREVGKYIEEIFPIYDIRIISINDNVDSYKNPESINSLIVPVKNLMNENYSRDISKKVSSAYKVMAKNGQFVAGTPPYGYMLDPNDKHHLIPDPNEIEIVKKIFDMALNDNGRVKICKYLNNNLILCRKEIQYRKKNKISLDDNNISVKYLWSTSTIGRMLSSETYIGNLVQLKTKKASFGSTKIITKELDDCIRSENTHEPIIDKDIFNQVQKLIRSNEKKKKEPSVEKYSIYRGILKCGGCGRAMTKQEDFRGNRCVSNYYCMTYLQVSKSCSPHKIKTSELDSIVLEMIQLHIKLVIELEKSLSKLFFKDNKISIETDYKNNVKIAEIKIDNLKEQKRKYYEDWKFEKIDKNEFVKLSDEIEHKINALNEEIEIHTSTYRETIKKIRKNDYWIGHFKKNRKIKKVSKEVLKELVETIYVMDDGTLEIKFRYQDEYEKLVNFLNEEGEKVNEKVDNWSVSPTLI